MIPRPRYKVRIYPLEASGFHAVEVVGVGWTQGREELEGERCARALVATRRQVAADSFRLDVTRSYGRR